MKKLMKTGFFLLIASLTCFLGTYAQNSKFHLINEQTPYVKLVSTRVAIIEGSLNGKKAYFLIDTGSTISLIDLSQKKRYRFKESKILNRSLSGFGGSLKQLRIIHKIEVKIQNKFISSTFIGAHLGKLTSKLGKSVGFEIVGILGSDIIDDYGLVIDYPNKRCWIGVGKEIKETMLYEIDSTFN